MLTVIARYRTEPGQGGAVAGTLARHTAATRAEPGCLRFSAHRSQSDPDQFVLFEQYADENAFLAHRQTEHFLRYVEGVIVPLLIERDWQRYDDIAPLA